jgi:6-phosphogluconate dehydrogenase (decarboxylating)
VWEEGRVISIKTLDLGAKSYQNLARLQQVVQGYIQKLAEFNEASYLGVSIEPQHIKIRELWLVIPGANEGQWKVLQALQELAAQSDVVLRIILWPSGGRR